MRCQLQLSETLLYILQKSCVASVKGAKVCCGREELGSRAFNARVGGKDGQGPRTSPTVQACHPCVVILQMRLCATLFFFFSILGIGSSAVSLHFPFP